MLMTSAVFLWWLCCVFLHNIFNFFDSEVDDGLETEKSNISLQQCERGRFWGEPDINIIIDGEEEEEDLQYSHRGSCKVWSLSLE